MTYFNDVIRSVRAWLFDEGESPMTPDYIDDILVRTAAVKQRPAWQSPWRWLLMQTTDTIRTVPRLAWPVLVLFILAALAFSVAASLPQAAPKLEGTFATPPIDQNGIAKAVREAGYDLTMFDLPGAQNASTSEFRLTFHEDKLDVRTVFDDPAWSGTYRPIDDHTFEVIGARPLPPSATPAPSDAPPATEKLDVTYSLVGDVLTTHRLPGSGSDPHLLADVAAIFDTAPFVRVPDSQPPCATGEQIAPASSASSGAALPEGVYTTASMTPTQVAALIDAAGLPAAPDLFTENGWNSASSIVFGLCLQSGPASKPQLTWWNSLDGGRFTFQASGTYALRDDHTLVWETDFPETLIWDFTLKDDVLQLALTDFVPAIGDLGSQQAMAAIASAPFHRMR